MSTSNLDQLISPEIKNDALYEAIQIITEKEPIKTVLEIGSSSGGGSTEAFVKGMQRNPHKPTLYCMEISKVRFEELQKTYQNEGFVKCYNVSSVALEKYATENEVRDFYYRYNSGLNYYPLETVLGWLKQDNEYLENSANGKSVNGIQQIKTENGIDTFDVVLIDGSEFTGAAELDEVYGATFILLDDINTFKNYHNHRILLEDNQYQLLEANLNLRNGYSIFKKLTPGKENLQNVLGNIVAQQELAEKILVQKLIKPRMTVFDVGANQGDYSLILSQLVGYFGHVYAFEPTRNIFQQIVDKIEKYGIKNISAFQKAVYSENTTLELNKFPDDYAAWNSLGKPVMKDRQGNPLDAPPIVATEIVEAISLDDFCQQQGIEEIDFLKVDVEGAESYVFQGCQNLLKNQKIGYIQFEVSKNMLEGLNKTAKETFSILINNGYECHSINNDGEIGELVTDSDAYYANYIAFPSLPINFFTIVLNGEPFIRYHIEVLRNLPFPWHWHIVEGVAELKHDTAWSLARGGRVTDDIHNQGRSIDGTSEYLDKLAEEYPENVTIYRKPPGEFWEGKLEMVNAPIPNIKTQCLLWQIDVDEFWTEEQIKTTKNLFLNHPEKTAAYYWCWYFVGEELVISSRNCYTQNPQQDWLRTWRFTPGYQWLAHEPPILGKRLDNGKVINLGQINPFLHQETEAKNLVFQHFAYIKPEQLEFKEKYYGYSDALSQWQQLQQEQKFPSLLRLYLSWVNDSTMVDKASVCGVKPILVKNKDTNNWQFISESERKQVYNQPEKIVPKIAIDGVFFQKYGTGIARVWESLLREWSKTEFGNRHLVVLDRARTTPAIPGIRYLNIPLHNPENLKGDRDMLQQICDVEGIDLFISSYYTTPTSTPSVFMGYDMIPEVVGANLSQSMWQEKHDAIRHASAYITISENTARDLVKFFPEANDKTITVAHCGVSEVFQPANKEEIQEFKTKYGIAKPYFLITTIGGYKNAEVFFEAVGKLPTKEGFEIVCTHPKGFLPEELRELCSGIVVHCLRLSDAELRLAYAGAVALVYPSIYEGFGLPVLEAMSCGTPVITTPMASIPEVGGEAVIYVHPKDVNGFVEALCEVQKPSVRQRLITSGLAKAKEFSWKKMAAIVQKALIATTLTDLNLQELNFLVFPDWSQPEEILQEQFTKMIQKIAPHTLEKPTTLLIVTDGVNGEEVNLMLSGLVMDLLFSGELEVDESLQISPVSELSEIQWSYLVSHIQGKIELEKENTEAITRVKADSLSKY